MTATIFQMIHNSIAETIVRDIRTKASKYYYFLGKTLPYNSGIEVVEQPINNYNYELKTRLEIIEMKQITANDVSFVIPRIDWVSSNVYDHYDDQIDLTDSRFYVVTTTNNVYKCLDNNSGGPSTIEPSGNDTSPFITSDGYKWKFMYTIPHSLRMKFMTSAYIPVTTALGSTFYNGGGIDSVIIEKGGTGYEPDVYPVTIAVQSSTGAGAELSPIVVDGAITDIIIDNAGEGYTYADITVTGNGIDDVDAILTATFDQGSIDTIQANVELLAIDGSIEYIKIVDQGIGYGYATVSIDGDGTGAKGTVVIKDTKIVGITITDVGENYTYAIVNILGNGTGASARAIMSPKGGHGKNAINEFFSDTLMFFSNISMEKNSGFTLNNDFRQFGIIKNPSIFNSTLPYTSRIGSTCFVVTGQINNTLYPIDSSLSSNNEVYKVVASEPNKLLLQAYTNGIPEQGKSMINSAGDSFSISTVVAPQVDKYSGKVLYVDNRSAFFQTEDQNITFQTVIKF